MNENDIKFFDGDDEIILSKSFNIYENKLKISKFLGFEFIFIFEKESLNSKKDILIDTQEEKIKITISNKFRNSIGSMSSDKIPFLQKEEEKILFSIFGKQVGKNNLHITINFYRRKI